jgi:two-component system response regulator AtoC
MSKTNRSLQVLVIDDEPAIRQILSSSISRDGHIVSTAENGNTALERLANGDIDVAICDIRMPDMTGIDVIKKARASGVETTFLVMTAFASVNTAIEAMRAGAYDYMLKPLRTEDVLNRLDNLGDIIGLRSENQVLREIVLGKDDDHCQMVSPAMQEINRLTSKVAPTLSTVMITGPSGVGKGVIASSIHQNSPRASGPFIPINCGAIPENLLESEFFGHVKGSFTGANKAKRGLFVEADQGTLFLDEIGELPLNLQVKLLHVIEEKSVRAVGSNQPRSIDVRILAATNKNIEEMVAEGSFREDLYFRLNVFRVEIPPLIERPEDLDHLIDFYIKKEGKKLGLKDEISLDDTTRASLNSYNWPGNVRELQNVISRALILADNNRIRINDLPHAINKSEFQEAGGTTLITHSAKEGSLKEMLQAHEYSIIQQAVEAAAGDRKKAAAKLGIGLSSLYRKLDELAANQKDAPSPEPRGPL